MHLPNSKILNKYIFREILSPFVVSIFVFTGVLFLAKVLRLLEMVISKSVPIWDIVLLFSFIVPRFLELAIPMSLLIGVLVAFGRFSGDSELIVMRASGISLRKLTKPVVLFAILSCLITLSLSMFIRPWATYNFGRGMFEIAQKRTSSALSEGVFNKLGPLTIYAESIDSDTGKLENVIISDRRNSDDTSNFIAKNGQLISNVDERSLMLRLYDGSIQQGVGLDYVVTNFDINNIQLDIDELEDEDGERGGKKTSEMYLSELSSNIEFISAAPKPLSKKDQKRLGRNLVEYHRRFIVPSACLVVAIIAMALGIQPSRGGESWGMIVNVIVGVLVIILYYISLAFVSAIGKNNPSMVWALMWLPNIILLSVGLYLYKLMDSERWMTVSQALKHFFVNLAKKLRLLDKEASI